MEPGGPGTPFVQRNRDELDNHENSDERIVFFLWQLRKQFHSSQSFFKECEVMGSHLTWTFAAQRSGVI